MLELPIIVIVAMKSTYCIQVFNSEFSNLIKLKIAQDDFYYYFGLDFITNFIHE